jgi:ribonuclease HI
MKVYVVTGPNEVRGIYETWAECKEAVSGIPGARYQAVDNRSKAEAMLSGSGVTLPPGSYAFTDGNSAGGVGIVFVEQDEEGIRSATEVSTSVEEVFVGAGIPGLESVSAVREALRALRNVLAELAGLYHVLGRVPPGSEHAIVHDYEGVAAWLEGRWKTKDPVVEAILGACRALLRDRRLTLTFQHQRGHQSTWAGRDDFAYWNARADALATEAVGSS